MAAIADETAGAALAAGLGQPDPSITAIAAIAAVPTILEVICKATGMGFAAVARVTEQRWIACGVLDNIAFGLKPGDELTVETTLCHEVMSQNRAVVIDHVAKDPEFRSHHAPAIYGFESYVSMPILLPNGEFFGTLCAIDPQPRKLNTPETVGMFKLFADLIGFHIDAHLRLAASDHKLMTERQGSELREQFIAVLGHDLRNPLASIDAGAKLLARKNLDPSATIILGHVQASVARMSELINNVLDFARGRLGSGLSIERSNKPLDPTLQQVVTEFRDSHPERVFDVALVETPGLKCDAARIGQLLSNLIGNALSHGAANAPIRIASAIRDCKFELSVANSGPPIPETTMDDLFKPFFRAPARTFHQGLGLGLYIAAEIARGHHGTLTATSDARETRFTLTIPMS